MQVLVLGTAQINTTDAALFTVAAGQVWEITAITITQPSTAGAKNVAIGFGTTATAANVKWNQALLAGVQGVAFYPGWSLQPAATLNVAASAGANEAIIVVSGIKHPIS
jgi:hypothetical protein